MKGTWSREKKLQVRESTRWILHPLLNASGTRNQLLVVPL